MHFQRNIKCLHKEVEQAEHLGSSSNCKGYNNKEQEETLILYYSALLLLLKELPFTNSN